MRPKPFERLAVVEIPPHHAHSRIGRLVSRQEELEKQMKLNALEHSMERRASVSELQEKGILKGAPGISAGLVAKQEALEKRMRRDSLTHGIAARPAPESLQEAGILKGAPGVAPGLVAKKEELEKRMRADSL